jgi:hypothetical protein
MEQLSQPTELVQDGGSLDAEILDANPLSLNEHLRQCQVLPSEGQTLKHQQHGRLIGILLEMSHVLHISHPPLWQI